MVFNILWTILLGIIGGIFSSLIVSRVLLIQSGFQSQITFVDQIIKRLGYISAFLDCTKTLLEVSSDEDAKMEREMKEKGYKSEMEYYAAHKNAKWVSKDVLLNRMKEEIDSAANSIRSDILKNSMDDSELSGLLMDIQSYVHEISLSNEFTFSRINSFKEKEQNLLDRYEACKHISRRRTAQLIIKDKTIIVMLCIFIALIIGTVVTMILGV